MKTPNKIVQCGLAFFLGQLKNSLFKIFCLPFENCSSILSDGKHVAAKILVKNLFDLCFQLQVCSR